ncbi:hypothetical protein FEM48_Zijuj10G0007900 [Ziziphus jujuba var. spinosa]|uniref:Protein COFACTOR ASSEMBLY OF COMPLEX C SUBUNIT B CCB3, chloroplastic n=1 Tax=Ziziphus jujuba var. spinosa TaxID=714518 RepID=A0A978UKA8_ZIZJJ|nr:hypothetical protein FEM48_Zijuj10G0007900 [Ziziphus jujuba var. spinosa]
MVTGSYLLGHVHTKGWPSRISKQGVSRINERHKFPKTHSKLESKVAWRTLCCCKLAASPSINLSPLDLVAAYPKNGIPETLHSASNFTQRLVLAELDPATAKVAIGFLGPFLSAFAFLFILRIVMSWYPKLPVGKFPYVIAYAPTEPLLIPTRKLIPPLGGVDVTPVVWFGLVSFLNEILVGPQGLLVLLSQQVS